MMVVVSAGCDQKSKVSIRASRIVKDEPNLVNLATNAPQLKSITIETANGSKTSSTRFTGRLAWNDDVTVRIFSPVAGRVEAVPGHLGQTVQPGDVLARLASPDFGQAQADLRKAQSDLLLAERSLTRVRELFEHGAAPKKEVDFAEAAYSSAQSEKERTTVRLAHYGGIDGLIDQQFSLKTPLAGIVVEKNVNPGQEIRPDQMLANAPNLFAPLFVVSDPQKLWLYLDVTELDMSEFREGLSIKLFTRAFPDRSFTGTIDFVGHSLDPTTRTVRLRAQVDNAEKLLKAEMYVIAEVAFANTPAASQGVDIPAKAVFLQDNHPNIFVETTPGNFSRRPVTVGRENDGKVVALSGIAAGERVVTDGCLLLQSLLRSQE